MKKHALLFFLAALLYQTNCLRAQTLDKRFPSTDGAVNATLVSGDTVYIGGNFNYVFSPAYGLARFANGSVKPEVTYPQLGSGTQVNAVELDGNGGMYLAGYFSVYNGVNLPATTAVIHLLADGSLDPAFARVNDKDAYSITSLKKNGSRLYIGGSFTTAQITGRNYLAALDANTGAILPWVPDAVDNTVTGIEANDSLVFIRGSFYNVGNIYTPYNAALRSATGKLIKNFPWSNNSYINDFKLDGNKLYLAGNFTYVRNYVNGLARLDTASSVGINLDFPFTDGSVNVILADGSGGYYIGGTFSKVGKESRTNLAHILTDGTVDTAFKPTVNGAVLCMAMTADTLYFGGDFTIVNSKSRARAAAVSRTNAALAVWSPVPNGSVYAITISGNMVYLGGAFTKLGSAIRNYAGAWGINNVVSATWNPNPDSYVRKLIANINGTSIFMGGDFTTIKTIARNYIAKVNTTNGDPNAWAPIPNSSVYSMALNGATLYFGGYFTQVNSISRNYAAAVDTGTAILTSFLADANNLVNDIQINNGKIYMAGSFTQIQGVIRNYAARFNLSTGTIDNWFAGKSLNNSIYAIANVGKDVVIGGAFSEYNAIPRNYMACIDLTQSNFPVTSWNPNISWGSISDINALIHNGRDLIFGGNLYYTENGKTIYNLISIHDSTGVISHSLIHYPNTTVRSLSIYNGKLMLGGDFSGFDKVSDNTPYNSLAYLAGYDINTWQVSPGNYNCNGQVVKLFTDASSRLVTAGNFYRMNNVNRNYLAAINLQTALPTDFDPSLDGGVYALALRDSSLFAGGSFSNINTNSTPAARTYLGAVNTRTSKATTWAANSNGYIYVLSIKDSTIYVGGGFSIIKGAARNNGAALSTTGTGAIKTWAPNTNGVIWAIYPYNNTLFIGGQFTTVKGVNRSYLAQVDNSTAIANTWNPSPDGDVYTFINAGNKFYAGGSFYNVGAFPRNGIVAFDTATKAVTTFNANLNSSPIIDGTAAWGKTLYVQGQNLTSINGVSRSYIGGVDTSTRTANGFNPQPNGGSPYVPSLNIAKNKLFYNGTFSQLSNNILGPSYLAVFNLEPLNQSSNLAFSNLVPTSVKASVTKGSGDGRIIIVRKGNTPPSAPSDSAWYTGNAVFGTGSKIGDSSYVVYSGSLDSVVVTGLMPNTKYQFSVYEYNGSGVGADYLTTPVLTGSVTTPCPVYSLKTSPADSAKTCAGTNIVLTAPSGFKKYLWNTGDTTIQVSKSIGSYSVVCTDSNGCAGTATVIVQANPKPNLGKDTTFKTCAGTRVNLTTLYNTSGYDSVKWSIARPDSVVSAGSYTLIVTNSNGCKDTAVVTVAFNTKPALGADKSAKVCAGSFINISTLYVTTGYTSVKWNISRPDSVTAAGRDTLIVTNSFGCRDTAVVVVSLVALPTKPVIGILVGTTTGLCAGDTVVINAANYTDTTLKIQWFRNDTLISLATQKTYTVRTTGVYKLRYTNTSGCLVFSDPLTLTIGGVKPAKPAITFTGNTTFCSGDSLVLNTPASGNLQWVRNNNNIKQATTNKYVVKAFGRYAVRLSSGGTCFTQSDSVVVNVITIAKPTITLVNDTLVSSAAAGNQWYKGGVLIPGATGNKYPPVDIDYYTVQVTSGGCKSLVSDPYLYTANTFAKGKMKVNLYPNPTTGKSRLEITGNRNKVSVTISDVMGVQVKSYTNFTSFIAKQQMIDLTGLPPGMYIVTITDGTQTKRIELSKAQ